MGAGLKTLIAAACVVVIAAGGLFIYDRYSAWTVAKAEQERIAQRERNETILECSAVFAEARNRVDGTTVPSGLAGNRVIETASADELRLRMRACSIEIPEFAADADQLSGLLPR